MMMMMMIMQRHQRQQLQLMMITLRVLGKFLGYIDFISYQSTEPTITAVSELSVNTRQQVSLLSWWCSIVVRTSVYDWRTFPGLSHDVQWTGDLLPPQDKLSAVRQPTWLTQLFIFLGSINE